MVILINASFDYFMFFKLNDTLNYLLTRSDIDPSSINILGHSHGGNYAPFGRMRSYIIHSVFCLDYGSSDQLMQDYFSYYHEIIDLNNYWTLTTFEKKFTLSLSNNLPANLFLLSDSNDQSFLNKISAINQTNTWWEDTQKNTIVSFSRGSARLLFNDDSLFSHGAGLYDPMAINQEVSVGSGQFLSKIE